MRWVAGFLALYAGFASASLAARGAYDAPFSVETARMLALLCLVGLFTLVGAHIATRDEVKKRMALISGAVSALIATLVSYLAHAFSLAAVETWTAAIVVFLIVYGFLSWRARS
ncbi:hypothetical protein [Hyphococcus sp.]|uniref:hypothetical protein n=1 Tax=Hyphococcus sp. TaxID=2038636 RepID=UPI003CCC0576